MEGKNRYLLRVEGVNLGNVLDDTAQISVERGAGLMLRRAVLDLENTFKLTPISVGASAGLFCFESAAPAAVQQDVVDYLNNDGDYRYLTFVVDYAEYGADFALSKELVIAKNRFRQFQQATLVAPQAQSGIDTVACGMNQLSPALLSNKAKEKAVSSSAYRRFQYGRTQRNSFYNNELATPGRDESVIDAFTEDLCELSQPDENVDFGNLNDKIALIYLDGNKFGDIQRLCTTAEALTEFDRTVRARRREFLAALMRSVESDPDFRTGKKARLETLLWGGDEVMLVVPAWKGFETLELFYKCSASWRFLDRDLTHAGALLFAHHKTPIRQLKKTARALADRVKNTIPRNGKDGAILRTDGDRFDYLVFESIDYPTQPIDEFCEQRFGGGVTSLRRPLHFSNVNDGWRDNAPFIRAFLDGVPKSAVHDIAQRWVAFKNLQNQGESKRSQCEQAQKGFEDLLARFREVSGERCYDDVVKHLLPMFDTAPASDAGNNTDCIGWLHLIELWDYIAPENGKTWGGRYD